MILYEVNIDVTEAIAADYALWLDRHIAEIVALPGFLGATRYRRLADDAGVSVDAASPPRAWTVHYRLRDRAALDEYLRLHAPRLRAEAVARFGAAFTATRRVLEPLPPIDQDAAAAR